MIRSVAARVVGSAAILAVLYIVSVPADPAVRLCGFHWLTGRPCPFCGLTRALFALGKGQWTDALHFNALSPLALLMLFTLFWNFRARAWLWKAGLSAFAVYGAWRVLAVSA